MRCPRCGNEVSQDEVFCGQCGTPVILPAGATEMVNTPSLHNGLPGSYNANIPDNPNYPNVPPMMPPGQSSYPPQMPPSSAYNNATIPVPPSGPLAPNQQQSQQPRQPIGPMGPQQQSGFYQDATEAIVSIPQNNSPVYPPGYQQQQQQPGFTGNLGQSGYVGGSQYGTQGPYQTTNFPETNYPASATPPAQGYGYGTPPRPTPPPKKQASALLVFAIVCLIVAIITVSAFGLIYLSRNHSPHTATIPTVVPTPVVTPTTAPSPTPSPTALATATPTPIPSPAVTPTPLPDPSFVWCSICTPNGFNVEYPQGWNQTNPTGSATDVRFMNTSPNDQYADFKTPGATTNSASELITTDLQTNYPGYTASTGGTGNYTIGGENWTYETATYQLNGQPEQVVVYATVHQQKAYIIELQASVSQYNTVYTQYYKLMLGKFIFQ